MVHMHVRLYVCLKCTSSVLSQFGAESLYSRNLLLLLLLLLLLFTAIEFSLGGSGPYTSDK